MKRYAAWGHDGDFRFKWQATLWTWWKRPLFCKIGLHSGICINGKFSCSKCDYSDNYSKY